MVGLNRISKLSLNAVGTRFWISICFVALLSCVNHRGEVPLSPALLFGEGSNSFANASGLAVKGTVEIESDRGIDSGDFTAYFRGRDSTFFLVEGPFQVDLLRVVNIGNRSFVKSRGMDFWDEYDVNDELGIEEYDIHGLRPSALSVFLFPQFQLQPVQRDGRDMILKSEYNGSDFTARRGSDEMSFTLIDNSSGIVAAYKRGLRTADAVYPSEIEIFPTSRIWTLRVTINKVKIDPRIAPEIWNIQP